MGARRRYAILYFAPLIISSILGGRAERAKAALHPHGGPSGGGGGDGRHPGDSGGGGPSGGPGSGDDDEFGGHGEAPSVVLVALLTTLPFAVAACCTIANAWHSKRCGGAAFPSCALAQRSTSASTASLQHMICHSVFR